MNGTETILNGATAEQFIRARVCEIAKVCVSVKASFSSAAHARCRGARSSPPWCVSLLHLSCVVSLFLGFSRMPVRPDLRRNYLASEFHRALKLWRFRLGEEDHPALWGISACCLFFKSHVFVALVVFCYCSWLSLCLSSPFSVGEWWPLESYAQGFILRRIVLRSQKYLESRGWESIKIMD